MDRTRDITDITADTDTLTETAMAFHRIRVMAPERITVADPIALAMDMDFSRAFAADMHLSTGPSIHIRTVDHLLESDGLSAGTAGATD